MRNSFYVGDRLVRRTNEMAWDLQTEAKNEKPVDKSKVLQETREDVEEIVELTAFDIQDRQVKEKLNKCVGIHRGVFALMKNPLGIAIETEHCIETNDNPPFKKAQYKFAPYKLPVVQEEVKEKLDKSNIIPCKSPYSIPVFMVSRTDGRNKTCIRYHQLSEKTTEDAYLFSRMGQTIDALQGARFFWPL